MQIAVVLASGSGEAAPNWRRALTRRAPLRTRFRVAKPGARRPAAGQEPQGRPWPESFLGLRGPSARVLLLELVQRLPVIM